MKSNKKSIKEEQLFESYMYTTKIYLESITLNASSLYVGNYTDVAAFQSPIQLLTSMNKYKAKIEGRKQINYNTYYCFGGNILQFIFPGLKYE